MSKISNAVAERQNTLSALIERQKPEIARALPRHMNPDRLARIATTVMRQTPKLGDANPASFLGALMTCAQLGLEPGPLGHAYLVPFKNHLRGCKDRRNCGCIVEVTFIPGYRGLVDLARRSGQVSNVHARVVRTGDEFDYEFGLDPYCKHRPAGSAGDVTHAYAVLRLKDGAADFDVMDLPEIAAIRKRSKASDDGPWVTDFAEMAKKTALRRLLKTAPMSVEYQQAVAQDERVRHEIDPADLDISPPVAAEPDTVDGEVVEGWPDVTPPGDADLTGMQPPGAAEA
jgi:recombination protein RecT